MQFSVISTFFLLGSALAAPSPIEKRGASESISSIVNTLNKTVSANTAQINGFVSDVKQNVNASVQVAAKVGADLQAIADALKLATAGIINTTTGGIGGILGQARSLSDAQIAALTQAVNDTQALIKQISVSANLTVTNLTPAAFATIKSEYDAVTGAVAPFVTPLSAFAAAISATHASGNVYVNGLQTAVNGVLLTVFKFLTGAL